MHLSHLRSNRRSLFRVSLRLSIALAMVPLLAACAPSRPPAGAAVAPTHTPATIGGSSASPTPGPRSPSPVVGSPTTATVTLTDALKFEPPAITVRKGTTVTWRNTTSVVHSVTDDPSKASNKADAALPSGAQPWDSGDIGPGQSFSRAFDTPGTYKYFCKPHELAGMLGAITVTG